MGRIGLGAGVLYALLLAAGPAAAEEETTEQLYAKRCQPCHGVKGKATKPEMNLADDKWIHGDSLEAMIKVIEEGVPGKAMIPNKELLTREQIEALARLVQSFSKKKPVKKSDGS
jgi:mono/diheme cytochrome c family protein